MIKIEKTNLNIYVEESEEKRLEKPEYFLKYDKIIMKDGTEWIITEANSGQIELMMAGRKIIKKEDISSFLENMSYVERAECFEKK